MKRILVMALSALVLTSCGSARSASQPPGGSDPSACPSGGGNAIIDWVDFFKLDGVMYDADIAYSYELTKADIGPIYAETRCKLSDVVTDPDYRSRDGDAGFLEPGTKIYELKGYDPSFRLVARSSGEWRIYESLFAEHVGHARELFDLEGKVEYIGVNSVRDGRTELGAIRDRIQVDRLVEMFLSSPVDQDREPGDYDNQKFVAFHLKDGSVTARAFYPGDAWVGHGISVPEEFVRAIEEAAERG
jgi:hypothetical protein